MRQPTLYYYYYYWPKLLAAWRLREALLCADTAKMRGVVEYNGEAEERAP
jgi:hypothetical protein